MELGCSTCIFLSACCLFFPVNPQERLVLPLCRENTPAVGCTGRGRHLHVDFPLVAPQGPHAQRMWSHVQDSHQARLAL